MWYRDNHKKWIRENADYINYFYLNRPHISIKYIDYIKKYTKAKIIYYGHDLHFLRELKRYELERNKELLESSGRWKEIEFNIFSKSDVIFTLSEVEKEIIKNYFPNKKIIIIPVYFFDSFSNKERLVNERKDILFVGGFSHAPNLDAVLWFSKYIFPKVLERYPDIKFYIVGSNTPEEVVALNSSHIKVMGYISDEKLNELYNSVKLVVIPLRYGAGVKGKTIEAMYKQVPIVSTNFGIEGLPEITNLIQPKNTVEDFSEEIIRLYGNNELLNELGQKYLNYVKRFFSKENAIKQIKQAFEVE